MEESVIAMRQNCLSHLERLSTVLEDVCRQLSGKEAAAADKAERAPAEA